MPRRSSSYSRQTERFPGFPSDSSRSRRCSRQWSGDHRRTKPIRNESSPDQRAVKTNFAACQSRPPGVYDGERVCQSPSRPNRCESGDLFADADCIKRPRGLLSCSDVTLSCPRFQATARGALTMGVDSAALIKTLNKTCLNALQAAAGLCLSRTNPSVEIEHWLVKLVELPDGDLTRIFRHFEVDTSRPAARPDQGDRWVPDRQPADAHALPQDRPAHSRRPGSRPRSSSRLDRSARGSCCWRCSTTKNWGGWLAMPRAELAKIKVDLLQPNLMKLVAGSPRTRSRGRRGGLGRLARSRDRPA